jgi:hypothetical protein
MSRHSATLQLEGNVQARLSLSGGILKQQQSSVQTRRQSDQRTLPWRAVVLPVENNAHAHGFGEASLPEKSQTIMLTNFRHESDGATSSRHDIPMPPPPTHPLRADQHAITRHAATQFGTSVQESQSISAKLLESGAAKISAHHQVERPHFSPMTKRRCSTMGSDSNQNGKRARSDVNLENIGALSPTTLGVLKTLGITTAEKLVATPTSEIADAFVTLKKGRGEPLKGKSAGTMVCKWKRSVREALESRDSKECPGYHDGESHAAKMPAHGGQVEESSSILTNTMQTSSVAYLRGKSEISSTQPPSAQTLRADRHALPRDFPMPFDSSFHANQSISTGLSDRRQEIIPTRNRHQAEMSHHSLDPTYARQRKRSSDHIQAFLKTLGITTAEALLSSSTNDIARAYRIWRMERNMRPLADTGRAVRYWKSAVRKAAESAEN